MAYTHEEIQTECTRLGLTLVQIQESYKRKEKVIVECGCGGQRGVAAFSLFLNTFCCKRSSKTGCNNPAKGSEPWNKGRSDLSGVLTGRPEGSLNSKPYGEEALKRYRDARKRITENGQPWSGFKRPTDEKRDDILYLVLLSSGKYKIGRSYKGAKYRRKEVVEVLGEWKSLSKYIWEIESTILSEFQDYKTPMVEKSHGRGMTEWFEPTLPTERVKERITALLDRLTAPSLAL
jgi:hypothetical protein